MPPQHRKIGVIRRYGGIGSIVMLGIIYLAFFPDIEIGDLSRLTLVDFEIRQEPGRRSVTLTQEELGGDIIIAAGNSTFHLPKKLWESAYAPDSLAALLQSADSLQVWLRGPESRNAFGVRTSAVFISPDTGLADYQKIRRWFLILIIALGVVVLIDELRKYFTSGNNP